MRLLFNRHAIFSICVLITFAVPALAQRVYWEPGSGALGAESTNELRLVFENCSPKGSFTLPSVPEIEFGHAATSNETSWSSNTSLTRRTSFIYNPQVQGSGAVVIPAFEVETDKGTFTVAEYRFDGTQANGQQPGFSIDDQIISQVQVGKTTVWVGEVIDVEYLLLGSSRFRWERATNPNWSPAGFIVEPFQDPDQVQANMKNDRWWGYRYRTRIQANEPGTIKIDPVRQLVNVQTGERSVFSILSQPTIERFTIESETPTITVLPLPEPAPDDFSGAVGELKLESKVVPETAHVGEPITWTLTLSGKGNWPSNLFLPEREISSDFEVVQPESRQTMDEGRLFSGSMTEDAVLIPTHPGSYEIGPVTYSMFDTSSGSYKTEKIDPITVTIEPAPNKGLVSGQQPPAPQTVPSPPANENETAGEGDNASALPSLPPDLVSVGNLPRDPVDTPAIGAVPASMHSAWWLIVALLPPALLWAALAWKHMLETDPVREQRKAKRALLRQLQATDTAGSKPAANDIHRWRALSRAMFGIVEAAPPTKVVSAAVSDSGNENLVDDWSRLWREAEAFLFGSATQLKPDWSKRAIDAARQSRIKSSQPPLPWKLHHWSPRTAILIAVFLIPFAPDGKASENPAEIYRDGRFGEARDAWSAELAANPKDWAAQNNIALTYAQEDEWNRAVAHWTAAFLLNPTDDSVRNNLQLALARNQGVDPLVRRMLTGNWADRTAARLAPGMWQIMYFAGGAVVALGLIVAISALYAGRRARLIRRCGIGIAIVGVIASTAALTAFDRYGLLAMPTAGLTSTATELRSIPTDLAETQQTTPIAAGTVVVVQRSFLGWNQVLTGSGSIGWIRRENTTPFYSAPRVEAGSTTADQSSLKNLASARR